METDKHLPNVNKVKGKSMYENAIGYLTTKNIIDDPRSVVWMEDEQRTQYFFQD